ncbi:helix-turn-helix transcriptional regulator [Aquabacter sp. L1I39]|uniref:helix-turn-helix domain-containing protein n=1 Tax=Aquabacter sp. L1I39 TaxID=2820278 RepID=UPI001ADAF596|nr:helix-turn-helix transcriptional regulator [Aquabacter sp. L1I39]QTL03939.1 helix-turn-helix transcriptional regulator [Aquabacter sp. L1I39]
MKGRAVLAWNVRALRVERGLSQERLAADAGIDRAYLGGIERRVENPTIDLLDRLAQVLDVTLCDLVRLPAEGATPPVSLKRGRKKA